MSRASVNPPALNPASLNPGAPGFRPPFWLRGAHAQTLAPFLWHRRVRLPWRHERLELPDGDFVDLAHIDGLTGPRVCLFHGLEGSIDSHYIGGLARELVLHGMPVTLMHMRGCSGEPNRLPRAYHSGDTGDMRVLFDRLRQRDRDRPLLAVGFSLSGNALLKYLGEVRGNSPLHAAVAVSVPFDLAAAADHIDRGFSRIYQAHLVRRMKASTRARIRRLGDLPIDHERLARARSFRDFDDAVTAPLHGFAGVDDYYTRSSCRPWLRHIETPTLIIHARDDPFVGPHAVPSRGEVGPGVELAISAHGGHVGFIAARAGLRPYRWLNHRIPDWLATTAPHRRHANPAAEART